MASAAPAGVALPEQQSARLQARLFWLGVALWIAAVAATWPLSLSFGDEVGYVGQARLFLQGRVHPVWADPGVWHERWGPLPLVPKYPLPLPFIVAPFFALAPALVFVPSVLAAVALAWVAGRVLQSLGHSRLWGLIFLLDPTVSLLSRTVMADVMLALCGLGTWFALRRRAGWQTIVFAVATMAIKTTGVIVVGTLLAGEALAHLKQGRRLAETLRRLGPLLAGLALGTVLVVALNLLSNGTIHSSYNESFSEAFGLRFLQTSGRAHVKSLLLCPPLLVAGVWPFWRRRDYAALLVIVTTVGMMCFYFFVDYGVGWVDSVVMSRRLLMPAVAFLLVGYAEVLARLFGRLSLRRSTRVALVVVPAVLALGLGYKHRRWQVPAHRALVRAESWAEKLGVQEIGITQSAFKIGLLHRGPVVWSGVTKPDLVLCNGSQSSYRLGDIRASCQLGGYAPVEPSADGYTILRRTLDRSDARP
jgi:hypothetical protein